jgi:hypothetical protein
MPLLVALAAAASMHSFDVPRVLGDRLDDTVASAGIPVLVPQKIRSAFEKLYGNQAQSASGQYALVLGAAEGCNGASVCAVANFYGNSSSRPSGGVKVDLARGRHGRYHRSQCGANCSLPRIEWRERHATYWIEYKESRGRKNMVRLANSAIKHGPR